MPAINIPLNSPAIGAKPCPKCGNATPSTRLFYWYDLPHLVSCGDKNCGFYQAANTPEDALTKWNKSTAETKIKEPRRVDKFSHKKIIDTIVSEGSVCQNCRFRKELYSTGIPQECKECGWLCERNEPYQVETPVYADETE